VFAKGGKAPVEIVHFSVDDASAPLGQPITTTLVLRLNRKADYVRFDYDLIVNGRGYPLRIDSFDFPVGINRGAGEGSPYYFWPYNGPGEYTLTMIGGAGDSYYGPPSPGVGQLRMATRFWSATWGQVKLGRRLEVEQFLPFKLE
jgi:hypothetical protein